MIFKLSDNQPIDTTKADVVWAVNFVSVVLVASFNFSFSISIFLRWRFSGSRKKIIIFTLYSSLLKIDRLISIAVIQILQHALSIMAANEAVV